MEYKEYNSKLGNICIIYKLNKEEKTAYMDYMNYDLSYIKLFIITLRNSIEDLKINGVKKVIQMVNINDWNNYLKKDKNWKLKEQDNELGLCLIECEIEQVFYCIIQGLGIYEDRTEYGTIL